MTKIIDGIKTVALTFSQDWIVIPPSASQVGTLGGLLRASTLTVDGKAVAPRGNTLPTFRLSPSQVEAIRASSEAARNAAFKAGRLVLPVAKRGRKPSSRGIAGAAFFASAKVRKTRAVKAVPAAESAPDA